MSNKFNFTEVDFNPFERGELEKTIPSTESQQEIWASCIIGNEDANRSYNESVSLILDGIFDRQVMEKAIYAIIERHEILRATLNSDGKMLCIYKEQPIFVAFDDLSSLELDIREAHLKKISENDAETSFNLQDGPLFRSFIIKISEKRHIVRLTAHHIICDGWSFGIILEDLGKLYSAFTKGEFPILDQQTSFSKYASEMEAFLKSEDYKSTERYWLDNYKNNVPILDLPTDFPRPSIKTYKSRRDDFHVDQELIKALRKTGGKAGSTLVSTLMAAFEIYLHRLTGQNDIIIGLPYAGQSGTGYNTLVGHCVNLLPLRSQPTGDLSFLEYLKIRKLKLMDDYEHQQFTFGSLLKKLNIARDSSRVPLVPVIFNIDMGMDANISFHQLEHKLVSNPRKYENFEIFLNVTGNQHSMVLEWSYNTQLFKATTIKRMMNEFVILLKEIVNNPDIQISTISLNTSDTVTAIKKRNNTTAYYPKNEKITNLITKIAYQYPSKTAIYFKDTKLSYTDLDKQSSRLANYLIQQGIQKGDIVALILDRSPALIISLLSIIKAGGVYLPIDPEHPKERIEFMLTDSSAKLLLTDHKNISEDIPAKILFIDQIWADLISFPDQVTDLETTGEDLAYILYTSGSTGKPKGVLIEHHSLTNLIVSLQKSPGITKDDLFLASTTISFDIAAVEIYLPLITGASIVLAETDAVKDGRLLLDLIKEYNVTIAQATPSSWRILIESGLTKEHDLKAFCGGEQFPTDLAENMVHICRSVWNMYAPTETTVYSIIKHLKPEDKSTIIGSAIDNTQVYILDNYGHPVPNNKTGEICIAGDGLARGYLNLPELTAEKFLINTFISAEGVRVYHTGDLGKFNENNEIECLGRIDQQLKIRGFRIEPGEIEYHLTKQNGIKEAIVISREDKIGDQRLVAYIVPDQTETSASEQERTNEEYHKINLINIPKHQLQVWKNTLKTLLPDYMIPGEFVALDKMPLSSNGKVDRNSLPKPDHDFKQVKESRIVEPRTSTEKVLAKIWSEQLNIDKISINSNFFELGGHSLIAVKVMLAIGKETGKKLPITTLFKNSTIEQLAKIIDPTSPTDDNNVTPGKGDFLLQAEIPALIHVPTIDPQKEIWLACELGGHNASKAYNLLFSQYFFGDFNPDAMHTAAQELVNRHESLRSTFHNYGAEIQIKGHELVNWNFEDISTKSEIEKQQFIDEFSDKNANAIFDLSNGSLFQVFLLKLSEKVHYLTISAHHIIFDGWSYGIAMNELGILYSSAVKNEIPKLSDAALFSEYALNKQANYNSGDYRHIEDFWLDKFQGNLSTLDLPVDFPRPKIRTFESNRATFTLDAQLATAIRKSSINANCSIAIFMRATLEALLFRLTGQEDIITGIPMAGQMAENNDNLIGHCVNMLPLRSNVDGNLKFSNYLDKRKHEILEAYSYQDITLGRILQKLSIPRDSSRPPLMSVLMNTDIWMDNGSSFYGVTNQFVENKKSFENFEMALNVTEYVDSMTIRWDFNKLLFKPETIAQFHENFVNLLKSVTTNPDISLDQITLEDKKEITAGLEYIIPRELPVTPTQKNDEKTLPKSQLKHIKIVPTYQLPHDKYEQLITDIWTEVLSVKVLGITDDFFDLGGHSLLAVKVMTLIEKATGKRLPLASLFENPTIEKLAKLINEDDIQWDSLVPIKTSGKKNPLYIVHGWGLNVLGFRNLANILDKEQPVFGLQAKGLNGDDLLLNNVEEIARHYVKEILRNNPKGPYFISGYSSGGVIAFEMARQFQELGKEVSFLAFLDSFVTLNDTNELIKQGKIKNYITYLFNYFKYSFIFLSKNPKSFIIDKLNFTAGTIYNIYAKFKPKRKLPITTEYAIRQLQESHDKLLKNYDFKAYDGHAFLFKGNDPECTYYNHFETNGWGPFIKSITRIDLPIDHLSFFEPEYVAVLAEKLQFELDKAAKKHVNSN